MTQLNFMSQIEVTTPGGSYGVTVERGALASLAGLLPPRCGTVFVVSTEDVWTLHGAKVRAALDHVEFRTLFFAGGEANKRMSHVERLAESMLELGGDRSSVVVAFGGGIVGDLAGFLAAIFMRGVPVIQVPTTLLAQVDASVGGKTATNLKSGKNLIGAFHQPRAVVIDPAVLDTLSDREYRAGLSEIVKTGVIADAELFFTMARSRDSILARDHHLLDHVIAESVKIKAQVVSADERESGLRRILNFGHTFGHALEAETEYVRFLHGEAVSWGMRAATHLAAELKMLPVEEHREILNVLDRYGPIPSTTGLDAGRIAERMVHDKKTIQRRIQFVLPTRIGAVTVRGDIDPALPCAAIARAVEECA
jgi:3-dehydroquinate synthase